MSDWSFCAGGLRVGAGRKFGGWTVNLFCLSFDQEDGTVGYIFGDHTTTQT